MVQARGHCVSGVWDCWWALGVSTIAFRSFLARAPSHSYTQWEEVIIQFLPSQRSSKTCVWNSRLELEVLSDGYCWHAALRKIVQKRNNCSDSRLENKKVSVEVHAVSSLCSLDATSAASKELEVEMEPVRGASVSEAAACGPVWSELWLMKPWSMEHLIDGTLIGQITTITTDGTLIGTLIGHPR